jgi:predicted metal-binding membrane protein
MASSEADLTGKVVRHERLIVGLGVALLTLLGWWYIAAGAGMRGGGMGAMRAPPFAALILMWWLMMVAMMLPSAAPAVLLYGRVREVRGGDSAIARSWVFLAGYLVVWLLFSLVAAGTQRLLAGPSMALENRFAEGVLLVTAGLYQLSPLKNACLARCRSPAQFLSRHWRPGWTGAVRLGVLHGCDCVGCCWMLMALLFVGGVMNLLWIVALTLIVTLEKLLPRGDWFGRAAGVALCAWGALLTAAQLGGVEKFDAYRFNAVPRAVTSTRNR